MKNLRGHTIAGTFFHAPSLGTIEVMEDTLVTIDDDGAITAVVPRTAPDQARVRREAAAAGKLATVPCGRYVLPGLVDLHIHAPQYPQLGKALDRPLEVWLQQYTFPLEARYADLDFAGKAYGALVADLVANGTTTAVMYGTIHDAANRLLVDLCLQHGLRALIGKVAMDRHETCPEDYRDVSADAALTGTQALIDYVQRHPGNGAGLVRPVVTPRFIPSCTDATLEGLGSIGKASGCHVQTHCSESDWQHHHAIKRYGRSDAESLDRFGLLSRRTILAHAPLLTAADMDLVKRSGSGIAHCPLSNIYFSSAVFPLKMAMAKGLRIGLGTDIAGGPSASMFDAARMSVAASRMLEDGVDPAIPPDRRGRSASRIDWRTAFYLATAGGGAVEDFFVNTPTRSDHWQRRVPSLSSSRATIRGAAAEQPGGQNSSNQGPIGLPHRPR